jgi:hypothetical protein
MKRTLSAILVSASLAVAGSATAGEDDLDTARHFLDSGLYGEAAYYLRAAADAGDEQAADILSRLPEADDVEPIAEADVAVRTGEPERQ